jgi:hypothetical protein
MILPGIGDRTTPSPPDVGTDGRATALGPGATGLGVDTAGVPPEAAGVIESGISTW